MGIFGSSQKKMIEPTLAPDATKVPSATKTNEITFVKVYPPPLFIESLK